MVEVMMTSSTSIAHAHSMLSSVSDGDPLTIYRMNRLLRLGAIGDYAQDLDILAHTEELTPAQVAESNEWALNVFNAHFANSPKLSEQPEACAN